MDIEPSVFLWSEAERHCETVRSNSGNVHFSGAANEHHLLALPGLDAHSLWTIETGKRSVKAFVTDETRRPHLCAGHKEIRGNAIPNGFRALPDA
jgi:hypothetical protein